PSDQIAGSMAAPPPPGAPIPPPPGVTPDVWAKLSPGAQAVAAARIATQGHPFTPTPPAPAQARPASGGGIGAALGRIATNVGGSFLPPDVASAFDAPSAPAGGAPRPGNFDETGGGLRSGVAGVPSASPPEQKTNVVAANGKGNAGGVAEGQGPTTDPLAGILRPGAGAGGAHQVGFSPADKNMLGSLNEQRQIAQQDAARQADAVGKIADTFAQQNQALAAD